MIRTIKEELLRQGNTRQNQEAGMAVGTLCSLLRSVASIVDRKDSVQEITNKKIHG